MNTFIDQLQTWETDDLNCADLEGLQLAPLLWDWGNKLTKKGPVLNNIYDRTVSHLLDNYGKVWKQIVVERHTIKL